MDTVTVLVDHRYAHQTSRGRDVIIVCTCGWPTPPLPVREARDLMHEHITPPAPVLRLFDDTDDGWKWVAYQWGQWSEQQERKAWWHEW